MFKLLKKSFWIPYNDGSVYPTWSIAMDAISNYCEHNNETYSFIAENKVQIDGINYEIYRGYESGSRGNYGIKCTEI